MKSITQTTFAVLAPGVFSNIAILVCNFFCKTKVIKFDLKVIWVTVILIFSASPAWTQTITLSDCINLLERDTSFFKTFELKNYDKKNTVFFDTDNYTIDRKSRTNEYDYLRKMVYKDSSANSLHFSFSDNQQFYSFEREFKLRNYHLIVSGDDPKIGGKVHMYSDPKGDLDFGLVEYKSKVGSLNTQYLLVITNRN